MRRTYAVWAMLLGLLMLAGAAAGEAVPSYAVRMEQAVWVAVDAERTGFADAAAFEAEAMEAIAAIEAYVDRPGWADVYGGSVTVQYEMTDGASHTEGGYASYRMLVPKVYLNQALFERGLAPIVHETTHVMLPFYSRLSFREGLAGYCQELFGGNPTVFSYNIPVHEHARYLMAENAEAFAEMAGLLGDRGREQAAAKSDGRGLFYVLSHSFVKYLVETYGIETFMKIYEAEGETIPYKALLPRKTLEQAKAEWQAMLEAEMLLTDEEMQAYRENINERMGQ